MAKFRLGLGVFLLLMVPMMIYIGIDARNTGIDLAQANGSRGAALFDWLGAWGITVVMFGVGVSEILTGKKLLKEKREENKG